MILQWFLERNGSNDDIDFGKSVSFCFGRYLVSLSAAVVGAVVANFAPIAHNFGRSVCMAGLKETTYLLSALTTPTT